MAIRQGTKRQKLSELNDSVKTVIKSIECHSVLSKSTKISFLINILGDISLYHIVVSLYHIVENISYRKNFHFYKPITPGLKSFKLSLSENGKL